MVLLTATVAHAASGWKLVCFTVFALYYMALVGYWQESMNSLALVAISVPLAIAVGFGFGVIGFASRRAEKVLLPILDLLQTVPAFAYLLPILLLFGFGPVVGLIASLLYSFPPMVRNTILGLRLVPAEIIESGLMSGATSSQLFWQVRVPSALRQILLGVNQATMASFSMVIIASIIGGQADIGWEVLSTMRKAQFGESVLAGIVIALLAMVMDRITAGLATGGGSNDNLDELNFVRRHSHALFAGAAVIVLLLLARVFPALQSYPEHWEFYPAEPMNTALDSLVLNWAEFIATVKAWSFFYVMLPVKIGLEQTVSPYSWGFELTTAHKLGYAAVALAASVATLFWNPRAGIALALFAVLFYFGITNLPWPAVIAAATLLAWQLGGRSLAVLTCMSLLFLLLAGVWQQTMLSVYLCGIAVIISFVLGTTIGVAASEFDAFSIALKPVNDTLQTIPLFVLLIPFVMIFKIGEFTALLAIIIYASYRPFATPSMACEIYRTK